MTCQVPVNYRQVVHQGKVFIPPKSALEAKDAISWCALYAIKIGAKGSVVGNGYRLAYANWNNKHLQFRTVTEEDKMGYDGKAHNSLKVGECLPTLESLNSAPYLFVPKDWPSDKLTPSFDVPAPGTEPEPEPLIVDVVPADPSTSYLRPGLNLQPDFSHRADSPSDIWSGRGATANQPSDSTIAWWVGGIAVAAGLGYLLLKGQKR